MRLTLIAAACVAAGPAWAQDATTATPSQQIVVTGNPLRQADPAAPASVLSDEALAVRRSSTLGETLDGLPGVAATGFGPNASRPVIRGQDGDRIRILSNAGASLDASSLSFDHAVPLDPLVIERIEVLRGPAALLYGGSALGGVVNAIDNRIPKSPLAPLSGALELRGGGAAQERALSGLVEGGADGLAWHADAFARRTSDLAVPRFTVDGDSRTRVLNSASDATGGALGLSKVWADGYAGASIDTYRNDYGVVVEPDVTIHMKRDKLALAGEWRALAGPISTVRAQAAFTDYQHQEVEGSGAVGTTFATKGGDARVEAVQASTALGAGRLDGAWGLQWERARFSALGEEAFVPSTLTQQLALFGLQRWSLGKDLSVSAGLRAEQVQVDSDGDANGGTPRFGAPQQRHFHPLSASLAASWGLGAGWQATASLARSQRAPTSYELYADGVHAATAAYERGNLNQALESGRQFDLGLAWQQGPHSARLSVFHSRFANYIALAATGTDFTTDEGEVVPVYAFTGVPARLRGLEAEGRWQAWSQAGQTLTLEAQADLVRGERSDTGEPLPRLAPWRVSVAADWQTGPWGLRLDVQHAARQDRVDANDTPTPGWTLAHLRASWTTRLAGHDTVVFARINNLGNTLATSASAIPTVRALSPLPGRSVAAGVRVAF
ncbi:TonB-dependent receptor [Ideonella alba]|uniref:TonB-dependent receptor n=1 Tax=Ideonella alba TaxID=2824118 RepID=UPI001FFD52DA|nr:TonB-dependent receptor [Ideonella alba]